MAKICPYTETCIIYKNWIEQTKDRLQNLSSPCSHITLLNLLNKKNG